MKEAAGEANMTVITIVLIGIVLAVATPIISKVLTSTEKSACCQANGGVWSNGKCNASCTTDATGKMTCQGSVSTKCK